MNKWPISAQGTDDDVFQTAFAAVVEKAKADEAVQANGEFYVVQDHRKTSRFGALTDNGVLLFRTVAPELTTTTADDVMLTHGILVAHYEFVGGWWKRM